MSRQLVTSTYVNGPLLVEHLYNDGDITDELFSFYIVDSSKTSYVDVGYQDNAAIKDSDPNKIKWVKMPAEHLFWYAGVYAYRIGRNARTKHGYTAAVKLEAANNEILPGIFDTGTSLIYVP